MLFTRRWILATLLAYIAVGVMIRLGIWQIDRLEQRRAFNAQVMEQTSLPPLTLDAETISLDFGAMEYRRVAVTGTYDFENEVSLRNREFFGQAGVDLLTPLKIEGTDAAILVNRGWIPLEDAGRENWGIYAREGAVTVYGVIRRSQSEPRFGGLPEPTPIPGETRQYAWNVVDLPRISAQMDLTLLPVYVQETPGEDDATPPMAHPAEVELTEGPHAGYAVQWFVFAAILAVGYPIYVEREERREQQVIGNW